MRAVSYDARMSGMTVRNIDPALWRKLKARAALVGLNVGELLNMIVAEWLADQKVMDDEEAAA